MRGWERAAVEPAISEQTMYRWLAAFRKPVATCLQRFAQMRVKRVDAIRAIASNLA
jgi:hypothetical protein